MTTTDSRTPGAQTNGPDQQRGRRRGTGLLRRAGRLAGLACLALAHLLVVGPEPAHAASLYEISGNFVGDERAEIFEYRPGPGADYLHYNFTKDAGFATYETYGFSVGAVYEPFVGDFDGDGYDELFWYAPGTAPDYIWSFNSPTSVTSELAPEVNNTYVPVTGDFTGDGYEDIVWYADGTAQDHLWDYDASGFTSHPLTFSGAYRPVAGDFTNDGAEDIVLYAPGTATDYFVDFEPGTVSYTSTATGPINNTEYQPFALDSHGDGYDDIFWYAAGTDVDRLWNYTATGRQDSDYNVNATYVTAAGDLFGDGYGDILWRGSSTSIWDWHSSPDGVVRTVWNFGIPPSAASGGDADGAEVRGTAAATLSG